MVYLFYGEENRARDIKILDVKFQYIKNTEEARFDYQSLDAHRLSASDLKKALIELPALGKQRVVVLHQAEKLSPQNKDLLSAFLKEEQDNPVLLIDVNGPLPNNKFFKGLARVAKVYDFSIKQKQNIFGVTKAMERRDQIQALRLLSDLLEAGQHPLQLLGGLTWFWGNIKARLTPETYKKGLREIQEADINIKRSRIHQNQAVEVLVVKLCCLL